MKSSTEILADQLNNLKVEKPDTPKVSSCNRIINNYRLHNYNTRKQITSLIQNSIEKCALGEETVRSVYYE